MLRICIEVGAAKQMEEISEQPEDRRNHKHWNELKKISDKRTSAYVIEYNRLSCLKKHTN